jgi:hypothetical protein
MALSATATESRDAVARAIYATTYAGQPAARQGVIDSALLDALTEMQQFAPMMEVDPTAIPDSFEPWFHAKAKVIASFAGNPTATNNFQEEAQRAMQMVLATYDAAASDNSANNTTTTFTLQRIRGIIRYRLLMRNLPVSTRLVDDAFQWALNWVWNRGQWSWRRRNIEGTIATDSTVTYSPSIAVGQYSSIKLWYSDADGPGVEIRWARPDEMQELLSLDTDAGRPVRWSMARSGDAEVYTFWPTPDKEYTFRAEVALQGPTSVTTATVATPFDEIPTAFRPVIIDLAVAKLLSSAGARDGQSELERAKFEAEDVLPMYDDLGAVDDSRTGPRDHYDDVGDMGFRRTDWGHW